MLATTRPVPVEDRRGDTAQVNLQLFPVHRVPEPADLGQASASAGLGQ